MVAIRKFVADARAEKIANGQSPEQVNHDIRLFWVGVVVGRVFAGAAFLALVVGLWALFKHIGDDYSFGQSLHSLFLRPTVGMGVAFAVMLTAATYAVAVNHSRRLFLYGLAYYGIHLIVAALGLLFFNEVELGNWCLHGLTLVAFVVYMVRRFRRLQRVNTDTTTAQD